MGADRRRAGPRPDGTATTLVRLEMLGAVARITLGRPEVLNALSRELAERTMAALEDATGQGARAIVLAGAGRAFSAGADLAGFDELRQKDVASVPAAIGRDMREVLNPLTQAIAESPVPVVCAIQGACAGGSVGVALAADVVLMARSSYLLIPQVAQLGIVPDLGATWWMPRLAGRARALGAMLLGERVGAEQAAAWGLVWACVDDAALADEALRLAERLARTPSAVVRATRELVDAAPEATLVEQLEAERQVQIGFLGTAHFHERVARFLTAPKKDRKGG
ncbi:2-(1,2-epoxy-1,2-dihydrophenyl)acetyl-CoA isomerase [Melaminivora alkalimesophila]|uniref:2-(1,2-epoxy-1,2-dihydrophenyl)acetyl-CoA isomerase n=2 Tax=Melaminivora alkalimesophila TaxID=1165852 RepID=A0A317RA57_9BURK|nr:enoyl-CoA hydratase-related protein [Melaminivora alkalimesophila]PWW45971.1 2-(1,2-epoxy-1,2-dihydrophenyl)acetyl-CoA isomerase [Melaminivora alkalimesophila]